MASISIIFFSMALTAVLMGFGVIGHVDPRKAFDVAAIFGVLGALWLILSDQVTKRTVKQVNPPVTTPRHNLQGAGSFSKAISAIGGSLKNTTIWIGNKVGQFGSWTGDAARSNPAATSSVVAWIGVLVCLLALFKADEHFWWIISLAVLFHAAVILTLAWSGQAEEISEKALEHWAFLWAYASVWAMVLTAVYGYEDGYLAWWKFPPFVFAALSFMLALLVVFRAMDPILKAVAKVLSGGYGALPALFAWGFILMIGGMLAFQATDHEFFDFRLAALAKDPVLIAIGAGFMMITVFFPVFLLLKFKK